MTIEEKMALEPAVFKDNLRHMCEIFADHTLPALPEWIEEALEELHIK